MQGSMGMRELQRKWYLPYLFSVLSLIHFERKALRPRRSLPLHHGGWYVRAGLRRCRNHDHVLKHRSLARARLRGAIGLLR